jgi:hypothetical protein
VLASWLILQAAKRLPKKKVMFPLVVAGVPPALVLGKDNRPTFQAALFFEYPSIQIAKQMNN